MDNNVENSYQKVIAKLINLVILLFIIIATLLVLLCTGIPTVFTKTEKQLENINSGKDSVNQVFWQAPDTALIAGNENAALIRYGKSIISNTGYYFGPQGKIQSKANGMNCQNCHLEAGTKVYGNNYSAVASTYPKFRERSGRVESIVKRVNDCFERSLNGVAIDSASKEMQAILVYINWLGKDVEKGKKPLGAGLKELPYLNRAADPINGKRLYAIKCESCHQPNGTGKLKKEDNTITMNLSSDSSHLYKYPPLWGNNSYNTGAGLFRISRFAAYIKYNMPQGATFQNPELSDEEAWDIAAYVNSQSRPTKNTTADWPVIANKPIDYPFGPYADKFTEQQHKYGPFEPIALARKK